MAEPLLDPVVKYLHGKGLENTFTQSPPSTAPPSPPASSDNHAVSFHTPTRITGALPFETPAAVHYHQRQGTTVSVKCTYPPQQSTLSVFCVLSSIFPSTPFFFKLEGGSGVGGCGGCDKKKSKEIQLDVYTRGVRACWESMTEISW